jgi:hypothetical protein
MKLDPIQRRQYGIFALLLSMVFLAIAAGAGVTTALRRSAVTSDIANANQECTNRLGALGVKSPTVSDTNIVASWDGVEGGWNSLSAASSAALACPGWTMQSFCAGQGCSKPGITLTLGKTVK